MLASEQWLRSLNRKARSLESSCQVRIYIPDESGRYSSHVKIVGTDVSSMDEAIRSLREAAKASPVPHAKATAKAKAAMQKNRFARTHMQNLMLRRVPENHRVSVEVDANHIGFIIGTHGATIKQLREIHEVKLDKIDTGFTIVGSRNNSENCKAAILQVLERMKEINEDVQVSRQGFPGPLTSAVLGQIRTLALKEAGKEETPQPFAAIRHHLSLQPVTSHAVIRVIGTTGAVQAAAKMIGEQLRGSRDFNPAWKSHSQQGHASLQSHGSRQSHGLGQSHASLQSQASEQAAHAALQNQQMQMQQMHMQHAQMMWHAGSGYAGYAGYAQNQQMAHWGMPGPVMPGPVMPGMPGMPHAFNYYRPA